MAFCDLNLDNIVLKSKQREALQEIHQFQNLIISLPTGYGKTIILHASVLVLRTLISPLKPLVALIIEPYEMIINDHTQAKCNNLLIFNFKKSHGWTY